MSYSKVSLRIKIEALLLLRPQSVAILEFLSSRKRLSKTSDLDSLNASVKKETGKELSKYDLRLFMDILEESSVGQLRKDNTKLKFDWDYWLVPIFDNKNSLRALHVMDLKKDRDLEENKSLVKRWQNLGRYNKASVVFNERRANALEQHSFEELLKEIQNRGFSFNIKNNL